MSLRKQGARWPVAFNCHMSRLSLFLKRIRHSPSDCRHLWQARFSSAPGIKLEPRKIPVIVSLTSIAERLPQIHFTIESLLQQTEQPDRLILWLDENLADKIPALLRRQIRRGLEIRMVEDVGPHTKIFHALKEFPQNLLVTADDDMIYPEFWLAELLAAHQHEPQGIISHYAHQMVADKTGVLLPYRQWNAHSPGVAGSSLWLFPTGVGGVMYPPNSLHPEVLNRSVFRKICPTADDVWLKAMSLLNNVRCQKVRPFDPEWRCVRGTQHKALRLQNVEYGKNDLQIRAVFEHYNLYPRLNLKR
jgi:hypothetical protein